VGSSIALDLRSFYYFDVVVVVVVVISDRKVKYIRMSESGIAC